MLKSRSFSYRTTLATILKKMYKTTIILLVLLGINSIFAQVEKNIYELNSIENLLTDDVKKIMDDNLVDKKVVFLGESNHYFGADLLAKTEFVKYLVLEQGYKNIVFESDFFGLYFDHNKNIENNLYPFWSRSVQGKELFEFIEKHNVTIWGLDNQMTSYYSLKNFTEKLTEFLHDNSIEVNADFLELTETFIRNRNNAGKVVGKSNLEILNKELEKLLENQDVIRNKLWFKFIESYRSNIIMNSALNSSEQAIVIRDNQMAKNLDFIVNKMPEKKFIIWLHNAHMIKDNYGTRSGQTMGFQFAEKNLNNSYHIAISSVNMPFRKSRWIEKYSKDEENLLHFLPSTEKNYLIDARQVINENKQYQQNEYEGMFVVDEKKIKTNWFNHYDVLVFISKGEDIKIAE